MDDERITVDIPDSIREVFKFLSASVLVKARTEDEWVKEWSERKIFEPTVIINKQSLYLDTPARIDSFSKLECGEGAYIGKFVHVASYTHLGIGGGLLILEQGSSCGSGVKIITGSNVPGDGHGCSAIDPNAIIKRSFVHVKRNATLFCGAIVLPGVTIGEGAVIAAGAVVNRDVPDGETWGGIPARKLEKRLIDGKGPVYLKWDNNSKDCVEAVTAGLEYARKYIDSDVESKCDPSCGCGMKRRCPHGKTANYAGIIYCDICACYKTVAIQDKSIGEQSLDMWVAAQAEMYCWDDDNDRNVE